MNKRALIITALSFAAVLTLDQPHRESLALGGGGAGGSGAGGSGAGGGGATSGGAGIGGGGVSVGGGIGTVCPTPVTATPICPTPTPVPICPVPICPPPICPPGEQGPPGAIGPPGPAGPPGTAGAIVPTAPAAPTPQFSTGFLAPETGAQQSPGAQVVVPFSFGAVGAWGGGASEAMFQARPEPPPLPGPMQLIRVRGNAITLAEGVRTVTTNGHVETISAPIVSEYIW